MCDRVLRIPWRTCIKQAFEKRNTASQSLVRCLALVRLSPDMNVPQCCHPGYGRQCVSSNTQLVQLQTFQRFATIGFVSCKPAYSSVAIPVLLLCDPRDRPTLHQFVDVVNQWAEKDCRYYERCLWPTHSQNSYRCGLTQVRPPPLNRGGMTRCSYHFLLAL